MRHSRRFPITLGSILVAFVFWTGCKSIQNVAKSKIPVAKASDLRITGADFSSLDLEVDLEIENPNSFAVTLSGLAYDLVINQRSILQGDQEKALRIDAAQRSTLSIPMSLSLQNLLSEFPEILRQDTFDYQLDTRTQFSLPLFGDIGVPLTKTGSLPVIRPPKIKDVSLTKRAINLTGADLDLEVALENPNNFDLALKELTYTFGSKQQNWASGTTKEALALTPNKEGSIHIPLQLSFLSLGKTVFQLLTGDEEFQAAFYGNMTLDSSLEYLQQTQLPFQFEKSFRLK